MSFLCLRYAFICPFLRHFLCPFKRTNISRRAVSTCVSCYLHTFIPMYLKRKKIPRTSFWSNTYVPRYLDTSTPRKNLLLSAESEASFIVPASAVRLRLQENCIGVFYLYLFALVCLFPISKTHIEVQ